MAEGEEFPKEISRWTKLKAKIIGPIVQREQDKLTRTLGRAIGRERPDKLDTAQELRRAAIRIKAKELGAPQNILVSPLATAEWLNKHGGNAGMSYQEVLQTVSADITKNKK